MVLSYSAAAQPTSSTPSVISLRTARDGPTQPEVPASTIANEPESSSLTLGGGSAPPHLNGEVDTASQQSPAGPSSSTVPHLPAASATTASMEAGPSSLRPRVKHLILDAGPLLSLTPLRSIAVEYHTTPAVLLELRDPKAREYWDKLGLMGVDVKVEQPSGEAMARVIAFARKTGDYAVLSQTDLGVVALTAQYEVKENGETNIRTAPGEKRVAPLQTSESRDGSNSSSKAGGEEDATRRLQELEVDNSGKDDVQAEDESSASDSESEDESAGDTDDLERADLGVGSPGETAKADGPHVGDSQATSVSSIGTSPANAEEAGGDGASTTPVAGAAHDEDSESDAGEWITPSNVTHHRSRDLGLLPVGGSVQDKEIAAACMTGDYAVQNVLLAMGLGLVGEGGKRIGKVKSWVLRCHACFKLCKDPSKKFCPSCGNPSLLRTSITTSASTGKQHIHLKKNYQYQLRGTKFTIPDAKMGRAKGQQKGGTGLILREDQREWTDAVRKEEIRRGKEEKRALKGWDDPDWLPEIITVGMSGKGRRDGSGMPIIGHGRKNPNVSRKKR